MIGTYKSELVDVIRNYELRVGSIESYPSFHILKTDRGVKRLKVWKNVKILKDAFSFRELLAKNGFRKIDRFIRTKSGEPYVIHQGLGYSLSDIIDGLSPNVNRIMDMEIIGTTLADFHSSLAKVDIHNRYHPWSFHFSKGLEQIKVIEKGLNSTENKSPLDEILMLDIEKHKEQINQSIQMAKRVEKMSFKNGMAPKLCHGNLQVNSFIIDEFQEGWLADIGFPVIDIPAYDTAKLITRVYQNSRMNINMVKSLLEKYQEKLPYKMEDKLWILTYLAYPHDLWKLYYAYYVRKVPQPKNIEDKYREISNDQVIMDKLYQELFTYFGL